MYLQIRPFIVAKPQKLGLQVSLSQVHHSLGGCAIRMMLLNPLLDRLNCYFHPFVFVG